MSESLDCFVCSELDSIPCPGANSDYASWKSETHQYVSHDPTSSNDGLSCSIIIGASGRVYHQSTLNTIQCVDPRYRLAMSLNIAQQFRDPDSRVICCTVNGCNWNEAHAIAGTNPGADSSALGSSDVVVTAVAGILLGFVVLIFCLFILFITLCRKKDEEEESETRLYFPKSTFDRKHDEMSNNSTQSNSRLFEQRSNFNSPPSSNDRSTTQTIPNNYQSRRKTKNAYDSNGYRTNNTQGNVRYDDQFDDDFNTGARRSDQDWLDVKTNNFFRQNSREKEKKQSNGKKPEWQNVYGKASQPADGAVNAFQWSE